MSASATELAAAFVIIALLGTLAVPIHGRLYERARIDQARERLHDLIDDARAFAERNHDAWGRPLWPTDLAAAGSAEEETRFIYTIADGAGEDASQHPFRIEAVGKLRSRLEGVRISLSVDDVVAPPREPVVKIH